jgi:hypothetical protein
VNFMVEARLNTDQPEIRRHNFRIVWMMVQDRGLDVQVR